MEIWQLYVLNQDSQEFLQDCNSLEKAQSLLDWHIRECKPVGGVYSIQGTNENGIISFKSMDGNYVKFSFTITNIDVV